jgi:dTMP kinase
MQLHDIACHGLQPDLTVYIDIDAETSLDRARTRTDRKLDRIETEASEFHSRVRDAYLRLAAGNPQRIKIVDGRGSISEVSERVWQVVEPLISHA